MESRVAVTWRDHSPDGCVPTQEGRRLIEQTVPFLTSVIVARKLVLHSNRNRRPCFSKINSMRSSSRSSGRGGRSRSQQEEKQ